MNQNLAPIPILSQRAGERRLGAFTGLYPAYRDALKSSTWSLAGGLALFAFGVFSLVVALDITWWVKLGALTCGLCIMVWSGHTLVTQLPLKVQTHEGGFVYKHLGGIEVVAYGEVLGVHIHVTTSTMSDSGATWRSGKIHAHLSDRIVKINPNIEQVDRFISEFLNAAVEPVLNNLQHHLRSGHEFNCGPFTLTPEGVQVKGQVLHYSGKLSAWVNSSHVEISGKKGVKHKFRRDKVVNAPYLQQLLLLMGPNQARQQVMLV